MSKKTKPYHFIVPLVVYPFDVMVAVGYSNLELKEVLLGYDIKGEKYFKNELKDASTYMFDGNQTIIRFKSKEQLTHATIAHEIFHAVTLILSEIGMDFKILVNDEAYAYLIGYLTEQVYKNLKP